MRRISLVHASFSAVSLVYAMLLLQQHYLLVFNPVLLIATWYLPLEIVLICGLIGWNLCMFGYWFNTYLNGGLDE